MEPKRNSAAVVCHMHRLPPEIIQKIQSLLTGKDSIQSIMLSKCWNAAWLSRPRVKFDERDFQISGILDGGEFHRVVNETIQSYKEVLLNSLTIFITDFEAARDLLIKAMKLRSFELQFKTGDGINENFLLPHEVLESKNLIKVSLFGSHIDGKPNWPNLIHLRLDKMCIGGGGMLFDILSKSTLIETLELTDCKFLVQSPTLHTNVVSLTKGLNNLDLFHHLKFLLLEELRIIDSFFSEFSSKFPSLKCLKVCRCYIDGQEIHIVSPSLQEIHFTHLKKCLLDFGEFIRPDATEDIQADFDVPRIIKFSFAGIRVPSIYFKRTSTKLEYDICLEWNSFPTWWFTELRKLLENLTKLEFDTITVSLSHMKEKKCLCPIYRKGVAVKPVVIDCLKIGVASKISPSVMDAIFYNVHPKCIYLMWTDLPESTVEHNCEIVVLVCKSLIQMENTDSTSPNRDSDALRDLLEVQVQRKAGGEFQAASWKNVFDRAVAKDSEIREAQIRFNLRWRIRA